MCIKSEFPKAYLRLIEWAEWSKGGGIARELELPSNSAYLNLPGGSFKSISGNDRAEQMDRMIAQIKVIWPTCGKCIETYYKTCPNVSGSAKILGISRSTFDARFQRGMGWFEGVL